VYKWINKYITLLLNIIVKMDPYFTVSKLIFLMLNEGKNYVKLKMYICNIEGKYNYC
jgi:hypothetical protein